MTILIFKKREILMFIMIDVFIFKKRDVYDQSIRNFYKNRDC